jgi:hypothetical protein
MFPNNGAHRNRLGGDSAQNIESPFLAAISYAREEPAQEALKPRDMSEMKPATIIESPFRIVFNQEQMGEMEDPTIQMMAEFVNEMHDEAFDEALAELANEAADMVETLLTNGSGSAMDSMRVERMLEHHFAPLEMAAEQMLESMAGKLENQDFDRLSEEEVDSLLETSVPALQQPNPAFEYFLKSFAKKAFNVVKKGAGALANMAVGPAMKLVMKLARPMIRRVLKAGLDRIKNPELRAIAQQLAQRILKLPSQKSASQPQGQPPVSPAAEMQYEFDLQLAELLFTQPTEMESELLLAEYENHAGGEQENTLEELAIAREQFIQSVQQLEEGEDPAPALENFIPAVLPALRLVYKVVGPARVKSSLARVIAPLIRSFVGKKYTQPLSRAIVDAGLGLLGMEATPEEAQLVAGEALANTVEETIRRIGDLPEYVMEDEALLEAFTTQAFEAAAAANLPPVLPERVYQQRPNLRESNGSPAAWVLLPRGPARLRSYQKYSRVFPNVSLTPHVTGAIKTFGGRSLAAFMRDSLGVTPQPGLMARVHVYEAVPGTWLSRISRSERGLPGLNSARYGWRMLHPLTTEAAGLLLGQPAMGREMPIDAREDPAAVAPGERFYYLEVPGARPQVTQTDGSLPALSRSSDALIELDFSRGQIRAFVYCSENDAQEMAVRLRQSASAAVVTGLNTRLDIILRDIFNHGLYSKFKINHPIAALWPVSGYALKRLPLAVLDLFRHQLNEWIGRALADFFTSRATDFVTASQDPADGVMVRVTLNRVPGLDTLNRLLLGQNAGPLETIFSGDRPETSVQVSAGFARG